MKSSKDNFWKATSLISVYECVFGALLNLHKSVLILLNPRSPTTWFANAGAGLQSGARYTST